MGNTHLSFKYQQSVYYQLGFLSNFDENLDARR